MATPARTSAKRNTRTSNASGTIRTSAETDDGSIARNASMPARSTTAATASPATPPATAMSSPSVSSSRTTRPRLAPTDRRIAISRCLVVARASIMLETLAHAATSTRPNAANTGDSMASSSNENGFGVPLGRSSARTAPFVLTLCATNLVRIACASSRVTPERIRTVSASSRGCDGPVRSSRTTPRYACSGSHTSRGESSRPANSDSQHANDREGAPVQLERAAEHVGVAIEHLHPGSMTEHGRSALRRVSIEIGERTADLQPWRQRPEVAAGHEHGIETAKARGERPGALCDDRVEQVGPGAQFFVLSPCETVAGGVGRSPGDLVEAEWIADRERPEDVRIEDGEHHGQQSEPDGERQDRRSEEGSAAHQATAAVPHVLHELLRPHDQFYEPEGGGLTRDPLYRSPPFATPGVPGSGPR